MELYIVYLLVVILMTEASEDWTKNCNKCKCTWTGGKKTADCRNISLNEIPKDLSPQIREIDFSNNQFFSLTQDVFINSDMTNMHKFKFQNCSIESVHRAAFRGLQLLIELDLSNNAIIELDRTTFKHTIKLRVLSISYNRLKRLEDGLFYNMSQLQKILLDHNDIEFIDNNVFGKSPSLNYIDLSYNRMRTIVNDFTNNLNKLSSLHLEGNPWNCDCHLQKFRNKTIKENLVTAPIMCEGPGDYYNALWSGPRIFACLPKIIEPLPSTQIEATETNVTLKCKVTGDPQPDINWTFNGRIIDKDPRVNTQRFSISRGKFGDYTWNNLTIINVNYRDRGEYKCSATNLGGDAETNLTLIVSTGGSGTLPLPLGSAVPLIIGLSVGAFAVLLIVLILICCCCKPSTHGMSSKRNDLIQSSDECIHLHGQPEMKKALITDVNPVMKPPRVCSVPVSVTSGGTEVSEVKKNLLDNDSVFAADDESRSLDFELQPYRKSQTLLDVDYRSPNHPYPPDLLSFPPRISQASPAGSSASTVADTSRLPALHAPLSPPPSLLHSPSHFEPISLYRTLPYSRSQSPFVSGPRIPRQGYVTIPRRPRQSWSSEPPTSSALSDIGEPLYDNLGLRTTADGSSALSLNKVGVEAASTPKSIRMFPLSPGGCDPIAECEPCSPERKRNADNKKVPPLPPPKPKKRTSTGPLFEDEGEDGTEV